MNTDLGYYLYILGYIPGKPSHVVMAKRCIALQWKLFARPLLASEWLLLHKMQQADTGPNNYAFLFVSVFLKR